MAERFHILHVEDDDLDALNVQRFLAASDVVSSITVANDGVEALEVLRSGSLPLHNLVVLLDIRLPRMSGLEFLEEVRADPELMHLPVVVLSTSDDQEDKATAFGLHVAGYLLKPISVERFKRSLSAFAHYWGSSELV
jgi:CheY-like chemotaxis protein